jgi:hypothetical protein
MVFCFWPGLKHAQYCIIPTAMETSSGVSVRQNGKFRCHRKISVMILFPAWNFPWKTFSQIDACGARTCDLQMTDLFQPLYHCTIGY